MALTTARPSLAAPDPAAVLALFKPVTWFPPMWAFGCGMVSAGVDFGTRWPFAVAGIVLAGPLLCATSQAVNDWFDRHVDAINEPHRPIPSGRVPGAWGLAIAIVWTCLSLIVAATMGPWVFAGAACGLVLAWVYSAPPLRLKQSGWWGPAACALSYEGLAWFTGAAAMLTAFPDPRILAIAALYSAGAFGIMTLNDFKAIEGDKVSGVRSLPVTLGPARAALVACWAMAVPQACVVALLLMWGAPLHASLIAGSLAVQLVLMRRLMRDPRGLAPWYNATGVLLFVLGMLAAAFALTDLTGAAAP